MKWPNMVAVAEKCEQRRDLIRKIVKYGRHCGLDATFDRVNRNLPVWSEWYYGRYATGYLIRKTGVRKIPSE